jgi:hypothetical protein
MGVIYMIRPKIPHEECHVYIGSTEYPISTRYTSHKCGYDKWMTTKKARYTSSFKVFMMYGFDNCECVPLEWVRCKDSLRKKEFEYIQQIPCVNIHKNRARVSMRTICDQGSTFIPYRI